MRGPGKPGPRSHVGRGLCASAAGMRRGARDVRDVDVRGRLLEGVAGIRVRLYNMRLPSKFFVVVSERFRESGTWREAASITGAGREWDALELCSCP